MCLSMRPTLLAAFLTFALGSVAIGRSGPFAPDTTSRVFNNSIPRLIRYYGIIPDWASRSESTSVAAITFLLYTQQQGGAAVWQETHNVHPSRDGRYSILVGLLHPEGVPPELFTSMGADWLGVSVDGGPESSRVLLVAVPYAFRALDADSLDGHSASEFVLSSQVAQLIKQQILQRAVVNRSSVLASPETTSSSQELSSNESAGATTLQDANNTQVLLVQQQGSGYAVYATSTSNAAIAGINSGGTAGGIGIYGASQAPNGVGMRAESTASSGAGLGVWGVSFNNGTGALGEATPTSGPAYGVRGKTYSTSGIAVFGNSLAASGATTAVRGENHSSGGVAGVFDVALGGKILSGTSAGTERFAVDSMGNLSAAGTVTASSFVGSGSSLFNVNAAWLNGLPASSFLTGINTGTGLLKDPTTGAISLDTRYTDARYLDVDGGSVNGTLTAPSVNISNGLNLLATTPATAIKGYSSPSLQHVISVFNSSTAASEQHTFAWMAEPVGNNTPTPGAKLSLQYGSAGGAPSDTGFSINPDGTINFANNQAINNITALESNSIMVADPSGSSGQGGFIRDDLDTVHSATGQSGSNYHFRLSRGTPDATGTTPDFLITPYKYGMAVEYNGVLEFWVGQFSVHMHPATGGGAQFWVGDDWDTGGLWSTARSASVTDTGTVTLAADKFDHTSHGSLFVTVRNPTDSVIFTNGPFGADVPIAQVHTVRDTTHNLSSIESANGSITGGIMADANHNAVRIGSRSAHPLQLVTGDTNVGVTLFNDGNTSIGNSQDVAALSVGQSAQFQVTSAGATTIGGGTPIVKHISATATLSFGVVSGNSCIAQSIAAIGASDGDTVALGVPNSMGSVDGVSWFGWVSAADTVSVRACNVAAASVSIPSDIVRADVWKH